MINPFTVISPEEMDAKHVEQNFVELYSDFPQVVRPGNLMIVGARGCGKSMLIRYALPDVQMLRHKKKLSELDYLAFRVHVKRTNLNITELHSLDNTHAPYLINEHFMAVYVLMHSLLGIMQIDDLDDDFSQKHYESFFCDTYLRYLTLCGCDDKISADYSSSAAFFGSLFRHAEKMSYDAVLYLSKLVLNTDKSSYSYQLPLLSFVRFIVPVFRELANLPGFPKDKPIYLFIDDADNLSLVQTEILNSWLACRTQPTISLKVSTQIHMYKTYLSATKTLVESPHDYQEVNISYLYTTTEYDYYNKAMKILEKRLANVGLDVHPSDFFPPYEKQVEGIKAEEKKIRDEYPLNGRGYRVDDDVRRYAIPNYIKGLGGKSKSRSTYRYAGIDNIIHLSSGIIRYLLDAASIMFDEASKKTDNVANIDSAIQNTVMRKQAEQFLFKELVKFESVEESSIPDILPIPKPSNKVAKLQNLICAMGKTFHEILISERSERKVFSIALSSQQLNVDIKEIFKFGIQLGFIHESYIGNKDGSGRTYLFIMNRCFAPIFKLDPTGFQGYLCMTNEDLSKAISDGKQLRNISNDDDISQLSLSDMEM